MKDTNKKTENQKTKIAQLAGTLETFTNAFHGSTDKVKQAIITEFEQRTETADDLDLQSLLSNFTNSLKASGNFPFPHSDKIVRFNPTGYKFFHLPFYDRPKEFFFFPKKSAVLLGEQYDSIVCSVLFESGERFDPCLMRDKKTNEYTITQTEKEIYAKRSKVLERYLLRSIISREEVNPKKVWYCGSIVAIARLTVGSRNLIFKTQSIDGSCFY